MMNIDHPRLDKKNSVTEYQPYNCVSFMQIWFFDVLLSEDYKFLILLGKKFVDIIQLT